MELQQLGWNAVTVGLCGIIFFTFLGSWALWRQNQKIWASKSGESVSIAWLSYFGCCYVAIFIGPGRSMRISVEIPTLELPPEKPTSSD